MHTSPERPPAHSSELQTNYSRTSRFFGTAISILAAAYILQFAILAFIRMLYPYELEWSESAAIADVRWIVEGHPLYAAPTINFLPPDLHPGDNRLSCTDLYNRLSKDQTS
jgi:hypothetical protein